jgi:hypothetical protein
LAGYGPPVSSGSANVDDESLSKKGAPYPFVRSMLWTPLMPHERAMWVRRLDGVAHSAFAIFFGLLGAASLMVGGHDATLASGGLGVTLVGAFLVIAAVVVLAGTVALVGARVNAFGSPEGCASVALVASLVAALIGFYVLVSALRADDPGAIVLAVAIIIVVGGLGGVAYFGRGKQLTLARAGTGAVGLVGTILAAWQFWYTNDYVPSHSGANVTVTARLEVLPQSGPFSNVRATLSAVNRGDTKITVVGSVYTLTGSRMIERNRPPRMRPLDVFDGLIPDPQVVRFSRYTTEEGAPRAIATGKFIGDRQDLEAGQETSRKLTFSFPSGYYNVIRIRAQVFAIRGLRLSLTDPVEIVACPNRGRVFSFWPIADDSWVRDLVEGRHRWIVIEYVMLDANGDVSPSGSLAYVTARFPSASWQKERPSVKEALHLFDRALAVEDVNEVFAADEVVLPSALTAGPPASRLPQREEEDPEECRSDGDSTP